MTRPRADRDASLLAAIAALPASQGGTRRNAVPVTADFLPGAAGLVQQAAKERRMSTVAYLRRAALAMACHDLEMPLSEALQRDPRVTRDTGYAVLDPEGVKFGRWEIERLVGDDVDGPATP